MISYNDIIDDLEDLNEVEYESLRILIGKLGPNCNNLFLSLHRTNSIYRISRILFKDMTFPQTSNIEIDEITKFTELITIEIRNCLNIKLPITIKNLNKLEKLSITYCNYENIDLLNNLPNNLKDIVVSNNKLKFTNFIDDLPLAVRSLDISYNEIFDISFENLKNQNKLENINLSYNKIHKFPDRISNCQKLYELFISNNNIEEIEDLNCNTLYKFDISNNDIRNIKSLKQLRSLTHLDISKNKMQFLDFNIFPSIKNELKLKILRLEANPWKKIEIKDINIGKMNYINLDYYNWSKLYPDLSQLPLKKIQDDSVCLSGLKVIIETFIKDYNKNTYNELVKRFTLEETQDIFEIWKKSIKYVHISFLNQNEQSILQWFMKELGNLPIIQNNYINEFTTECGILINAKSIIGIKLNDKKLTCLPENIGILKNLSHLIINNNYIKSIPESLLNCKKLAHIDISNNPISELPNINSNLSKLEILKIKNIKFKKYPWHLKGNKSIKVIDIGLWVNIPENMRKYARKTHDKYLEEDIFTMGNSEFLNYIKDKKS